MHATGEKGHTQQPLAVAVDGDSQSCFQSDQQRHANFDSNTAQFRNGNPSTNSKGLQDFLTAIDQVGERQQEGKPFLGGTRKAPKVSCTKSANTKFKLLVALLVIVAMAVTSIVAYIVVHNHAQHIHTETGLYEVTWGGNSARNKVYQNAGLPPSLVSSASFGRRNVISLPLFMPGESVYAQPLAYSINNTEYILVITAANNAYVINGLNATITSSKNFGYPHAIAFDPVFQGDRTANVTRFVKCNDIVDFVGTVGTPVIDLVTNTAYFFSITANPPPAPFTRIMSFHAVDALTLQERPGFPITIAPVSENNPTLKFDPQFTYQRPGLLLYNGVVYGTFGGHCDLKKQGWSGWLIGVDAETGQITTAWSAQGGSNFANGGGAIWMSGAGVAVDEDGDLYLTTGTGLNSGMAEYYMHQAPLSGSQIPENINEAFVKFSVSSDGKAYPVDFLLPQKYEWYDKYDFDFGSGGALILPGKYQGLSGQRLTVAIDKPGRVLVLDRDDLGGFGRGPNGTDKVVSFFDLGAFLNSTQGKVVGYFNTPTLWDGDGDGYLYVSVNNSNVFALQWDSTTTSFNISGKSDFRFNPRTPAMDSMPGMPVVTSSGLQAGSALVWTTDVSGVLYATTAVPNANIVDPVDSLATMKTVFMDMDIGPLSKFAIPGFSQTGSGLVYVATNDGKLVIYGRKIFQ
ncbi:UNVERIFIED_CONTAM: hypothetical protein HDU68_007943 [Siphonaria sp. JEL0065]|nr:hypothetical protein HDU68_007943 [Siphonaria sp. JEL0065]